MTCDQSRTKLTQNGGITTWIREVQAEAHTSPQCDLVPHQPLVGLRADRANWMMVTKAHRHGASAGCPLLGNKLANESSRINGTPFVSHVHLPISFRIGGSRSSSCFFWYRTDPLWFERHRFSPVLLVGFPLSSSVGWLRFHRKLHEL